VQIISERVGKEKFVEQLTSVAQSRIFSKTMQRHDAINHIDNTNELCLDRLFCQQVRKLELQVVHALESGPEQFKAKEDSQKALAENAQLQSRLQELEAKVKLLNTENVELVDKNEQLGDQNAVLLATKAMGKTSVSGENGGNGEDGEESENDPNAVSNIIMGLRSDVKGKSAEVNDLKNELERVNKEQENDMEQSLQAQTRVSELESQIQILQSNQSSQVDNGADKEELSQLQETMKIKEASLSQLRKDHSLITVNLEQEKGRVEKLEQTLQQKLNEISASQQNFEKLTAEKTSEHSKANVCVALELEALKAQNVEINQMLVTERTEAAANQAKILEDLRIAQNSQKSENSSQNNDSALSDLQALNRTVTTELEQLKVHQNTLKTELETTLASTKTLKDQLESVEESKKPLFSEIDSLKKEIHQKSRETDLLKKDLEEKIESEKLNHKTELEKVETEKSRLSAENLKLEAEKVKLSESNKISATMILKQKPNWNNSKLNKTNCSNF
jgi:chromosome segregation ATPase